MPTKQKLTNEQLVFAINALEPSMAKLSEADFPKKTAELKGRLARGETVDDLLPESFALVREAAKRTLKQRHFDVQLLGGIVLHQGKVAEIKTGEGKTLVATLPAYLNALTGKGVHIVTVNDYLARRDALWMGPIYDLLGLTVATIVPDKSFRYSRAKRPADGSFPVSIGQALERCTRKEAYQADITYGHVSEFGFDYLRDNMVMEPAAIVQRPAESGGYQYAILDEVDSILIDEARTPLILAGERKEDTSLFTSFARAISSLQERRDYEVDPELKTAFLTEEGQTRLEQSLGIDNLYNPEKEYAFHADAALRAHTLYRRDKEYVVKNGEVVIVDEFTGRLMYGRRFSEGIHQALEAKEAVPVKPESRTLAAISLQSYFRKYQKLAGMSGTAAPAQREFEQVYGMTVETIPTNQPVVRDDQPDRIFLTRKGKEQAIAREVSTRRANLQPVLVGTRSVEANEHLAGVLRKANIKNQVLSAKNHAEEAAVIAQAGRSAAVTVATNLAGRGVDILLGGNPPDLTDGVMVKAAGGLAVIGTERHESKRIDDQLKGRAGRQGDPGVSVFFLSLEDELPRTFAQEEVELLKQKYGTRSPNQPLPKRQSVTAAFDLAQQRVEQRNAEMRVLLTKYDDFVGKQRDALYKLRRGFLTAPTIREGMKRDIQSWIEGMATMVKQYRASEEETIVDFSRALRIMRPLFVGVSDDVWLREFKQVKNLAGFQEMALRLVDTIEKKVVGNEGEAALVARARQGYLAAVDALWMEHLTELETIRAGIDLTALAGKEPLDEFKREADEKYRALLARIPTLAVETYLKRLV